MACIVIETRNEQEEKVLLAFLNALQYHYEISNLDTTEYLLSSNTNKQHILDSIQESKDGKVTKVSINDLWK